MSITPQVEMVSDEMVEAAMVAYLNAWGRTTVKGSMKAALQAALNARACGDAKDAERYRVLRDSTNCTFTLTHNDHHVMYRSVEDTLDDPFDYYGDTPDDERAKMIATDTIWTLHIYPNTPVGFNVYHAASLDAVVDAALASQAVGVKDGR